MLVVGRSRQRNHVFNLEADVNTKAHFKMLLARSLASLTLGIAGTALVGYFVDRGGLYTWPGSNAMALSTSVALFSVALAFLVFTFTRNGK